MAGSERECPISLNILWLSLVQGLMLESPSRGENPSLETSPSDGRLLPLDPAVLAELQTVFNPEMAYTTYIPFSCLLGMAPLLCVAKTSCRGSLPGTLHACLLGPVHLSCQARLADGSNPLGALWVSPYVQGKGSHPCLLCCAVLLAVAGLSGQESPGSCAGPVLAPGLLLWERV